MSSNRSLLLRLSCAFIPVILSSATVTYVMSAEIRSLRDQIRDDAAHAARKEAMYVRALMDLGMTTEQINRLRPSDPAATK